MHQVPSDPSSVVLVGDFDSVPPETIFEYLTSPEHLVKWWPQLATSEQREGGTYVYSWPDQSWNLRGEFTHYEPAVHLTFTWNWDHEPGGQSEQLVDIWLEPLAQKGTRIGIFHEPFQSGDVGAADRQGVAEGWIHFMMRLAGQFDARTDQELSERT